MIIVHIIGKYRSNGQVFLQVYLPGVSRVLLDWAVGAFEFVSRSKLVKRVPGDAVTTGQFQGRVLVGGLLTQNGTGENGVVA